MILKEGNINVEDAILKRLIDKKPVLITGFLIAFQIFLSPIMLF